jgi:hypothetical protein
MPSNTFTCRVTSYADLQPRLTGIVPPPPSASTPSFASSSPSCGVQPHCRCSAYEGLSCAVCSPRTGMQLSQPAILSISPPAPGLVRAAPSLGLKLGQGLVEKSAPVQDKSKRKLVNPLTIRIPRRVVPSQPDIPQGGHVSPNSNIQVKVEDPAPAPLYLTPASAHVSPHTQQNPTRMPKEVGTHPDQRIPSVLPPEVQVIIDAYVSGTPLIIIATKSMLKACWGVSVSEECGYAYLGFFSVGQVLVSPAQPLLSPTQKLTPLVANRKSVCLLQNLTDQRQIALSDRSNGGLSVCGVLAARRTRIQLQVLAHRSLGGFQRQTIALATLI